MLEKKFLFEKEVVYGLSFERWKILLGGNGRRRKALLEGRVWSKGIE